MEATDLSSRRHLQMTAVYLKSPAQYESMKTSQTKHVPTAKSKTKAVPAAFVGDFSSIATRCIRRKVPNRISQPDVIKT